MVQVPQWHGEIHYTFWRETSLPGEIVLQSVPASHDGVCA